MTNWLKASLPVDRFRVVAQDYFTRGRGTKIDYTADIVIYDRQDGSTLAVLDTKYKVAKNPVSADVHQVLAYGMLLNARIAGLIYPHILDRHIDTAVDSQGTHFKMISFPLEQAPDRAGQHLLATLLAGRMTKALCPCWNQSGGRPRRHVAFDFTCEASAYVRSHRQAPHVGSVS